MNAALLLKTMPKRVHLQPTLIILIIISLSNKDDMITDLIRHDEFQSNSFEVINPNQKTTIINQKKLWQKQCKFSEPNEFINNNSNEEKITENLKL